MLELVSTLNQKEKMAVSQMECESWQSCFSSKCKCSMGQWSLGRITEVVERYDGFVRVTKVQVGGIVVTHSITKISPLEVNEGNQNIMTVRHGRGE